MTELANTVGHGAVSLGVSFGVSPFVTPPRPQPRPTREQTTDALIGVPILHGPPASSDRPALRLMIAVLEQAIDDLRAHRGAAELWRRQLYMDAYTWTASSDRSHAFTFLNVCEALGYSPSAVRRRVLF